MPIHIPYYGFLTLYTPSKPEHVRKLPVTLGYRAVIFPTCDRFFHLSQMVSHDLPAIWQEKWRYICRKEAQPTVLSVQSLTFLLTTFICLTCTKHIRGTDMFVHCSLSDNTGHRASWCSILEHLFCLHNYYCLWNAINAFIHYFSLKKNDFSVKKNNFSLKRNNFSLRKNISIFLSRKIISL